MPQPPFSPYTRTFFSRLTSAELAQRYLLMEQELAQLNLRRLRWPIHLVSSRERVTFDLFVPMCHTPFFPMRQTPYSCFDLEHLF